MIIIKVKDEKNRRTARQCVERQCVEWQCVE